MLGRHTQRSIAVHFHDRTITQNLAPPIDTGCLLCDK